MSASDSERSGQSEAEALTPASAMSAARFVTVQDADGSSDSDGLPWQEGTAARRAMAARLGAPRTDSEAPDRAADPAPVGQPLQWVSGFAIPGSGAATPALQPSLSWAPQFTLHSGAFDAALGLAPSTTDRQAVLARIDGAYRQVNDELQADAAHQQTVILSSIAAGTGLTIGYALWLVRGGALLASIASAIPAWASIDPLPVLSRHKPRGSGGRDPEDSDHGADNPSMPGDRRDKVERLFSYRRQGPAAM
jgi:hypothetical protein